MFLPVVCLIFILFGRSDCVEHKDGQDASLMDLRRQLKTRLIDHRGNDGGQYSYLGLLYNIVDKIGDIIANEDIAELKNKVARLEETVDKIQDLSETAEAVDMIPDLSETVKQTELEVIDVKLSLRSELSLLKREVTDRLERKGTTYFRWGKTTCPGNGSTLLYKGFAGGSYYSHTGGAADMLCLPDDPDWEKYDDTLQHGGLIFGAEYNDAYRPNTAPNDHGLYNDDVPCVACNLEHRSSVIMIPGKSSCYSGWTREYWGYLMAGNSNHAAATNYYCVDSNPEGIPNTKASVDGYVLYYVEGRCGSLPCPPYVNYRELTCVVCTK